MSSKRTIRDETKRSDRLGSLTLKDLVNDSEEWNPTGEYELIDPYFDHVNPENKDEFGELVLNDRVNVVEYTDNDGIPRTHINLYDLLADYVRDQNDFMVFVGLLQEVFDDIKSVADIFDQLSDVESVVEMFLPKLAYLLNHRYRYDIPDHINRDIIRRLLWLYEQKATDQDVLDSADYGANSKWVGSTLFLPDAVPDERLAEIFYPVHSLFTHNVSGFSRTDRYPDSSRYRGGVIVIKVKKLNARIREAVRRVLPAGLKCYYDFDGTFGGGDGEGESVDFGAWYQVNEDTLLDQALIINDKTTRPFDGDYRYQNYFDGRQLIFCDNLIYYLLGISWFPNLPEDDVEGNVIHDPDDYPFPIPEPKKIWEGFRSYSGKGRFSGKLRIEGEGNTQWVQTPIYSVKPTDKYYRVDTIEDLVVNPWIDDSRYHQVYIGNDRYAMNSFWDSPKNLKDGDWVEIDDKKAVRFDELESIEDILEHGLIRHSYSNHFYLENYNEPIEFHWDRRLLNDFGVMKYSLPMRLPLDLTVDSPMYIPKEVHSDAFDGSHLYGNIFDGRGMDITDFQIDLIRDPKLFLELIFDHEDTWTDVFDGFETLWGEYRSGLGYFETFPFEFKASRDLFIELIIKENRINSTTLSGEDTELGERRSGIYDDYTYPFEVIPTPPDKFTEIHIENEVDSNIYDGPDTVYGEIRSGRRYDETDPVEVSTDYTFEIEKSEETSIDKDTFLDIESVVDYDIQDETIIEFQKFHEVRLVMLLNHEEADSDQFDEESTYRGEIRSGRGWFYNDGITVNITKRKS